MRFPQPLARARLVRRYKRFLADVVIEGEAAETTVHVPNPGAMLGLADPGLTVWLSRSASPTRKLPWTLELVEADGGLVGINTLLPNRLVAEALAADAILELAGYARRRPEVRYGEASRVDFLLEDDHRPPCWLEVKNEPQDSNHPEGNIRPSGGAAVAGSRAWVEVKGVTLSRQRGLAEWPDCVSSRATRHLGELRAMAACGDRAVVLFVVQRSDCHQVASAEDLDPIFSRTLRAAVADGVEVLAYGCHLDNESITIGEEALQWLG